jgi:predicted enzyme related to lactoylglutathione lyase
VGGTLRDEATAIYADAAGAVYLGGQTASPEFPVTSEAYDTTLNGPNDGCLAKLSPSGDNLLLATLLGGSGEETIYCVLADDDGNIYVSGNTGSDDFPTTPGAYDETYNGGGDIFVAKFNPTGDTLLFSTVIGGSGVDRNAEDSLAMDASGALYVSGTTSSSDFPVTPGAFDESYNGGGDGFVVKLAPDGSSVGYATFIGGSASDGIRNLAANASGEAFVTGLTQSGNFPVTPGAYDETYNGYSDWFVAKLNVAGNSLEYATYLGGSDSEQSPTKLLITTTGEVYLSGTTDSPDFPTTPGAYDRSFSFVDGVDVITAKLSATGADLLASTFAFGGLGGAGLASDSSGNLWCLGLLAWTNAVATPGAYRIELDGSAIVVASIDPDLTQLRYATFIEGTILPVEFFLAIDPSDSVYGFLGTHGSGWPATSGAFDPSYNGDRDHFVFRLDPEVTELPTIVCPPDIYVGCSVDRLAPVTFPDPEVSDILPGMTIECDPPSGSGFRVGTTVVTCAATYLGGYTASCSFNVIRSELEFTGFLPPIDGADDTGGSRTDPIRTFTVGRVIPVRFTAACDGDPVLTGIHRLQAIKFRSARQKQQRRAVSSSAMQAIDRSGTAASNASLDTPPPVAANTTHKFRLTDRGWQYKLNTVDLGPGTWKLVATLSDGSKHSAWIAVKK